ncbi:archease, partial [Ferroplasma acidiphilum]
MKYDILDHTADLKIKVYGNSLNSIFENSVAAISDLITGSSSMENTIKRKVEITKQSVDDMLIQLLNDVIFYLETENVLFQRAEINISGNRL